MPEAQYIPYLCYHYCMTEDEITIITDQPDNSTQLPVIDISESDLRQHELMQALKKEATDEITLPDGSIVRLGLPPVQQYGIFNPPNIPHIFESDVTLVREGGGSAVKEAMERKILPVVNPNDLSNNNPLGDYLNIGKSMVIYCHGINTGTGDGWYFADGQNIPQVVRSYNSYAEQNGIPKIELIAACNADRNEVDLNTNMVIDPEANQVRVGAFNEVAGDSSSIAYVVGELAQGSGRVDPNHGIVFVLETQRKSIFNIENLIAIKELMPGIEIE